MPLVRIYLATPPSSSRPPRPFFLSSVNFEFDTELSVPIDYKIKSVTIFLAASNSKINFKSFNVIRLYQTDFPIFHTLF